MCIQTLRNLLGMTEIGKPKNIQDITANEILQLLASSLGYYPTIKMFDTDYKTTDYNEYMRFIKADQTNLLLYESEEMDCDDFAVALWGSFTKTKYWSGLAFGQCSVHDTKKDVYHAINLFITNNHDIYYCEPQNDKVWLMSVEQDYEPYFIMF